MKNKELTKDELKKAITVMKNVLGITHDTRLLANKNECRKAIKEIADKYAKLSKKEKVSENNFKSENMFLKTQIEELKKKHEEQIAFYERAIRDFNNYQKDYVIQIEYSKNRTLIAFGKKEDKKWWQFWK